MPTLSEVLEILENILVEKVMWNACICTYIWILHMNTHTWILLYPFILGSSSTLERYPLAVIVSSPVYLQRSQEMARGLLCLPCPVVAESGNGSPWKPLPPLHTCLYLFLTLYSAGRLWQGGGEKGTCSGKWGWWRQWGWWLVTGQLDNKSPKRRDPQMRKCLHKASL